MTSCLVVIDDATTISVIIIITIAICVQTIEKISKSLESNVVPRERCLNNIRLGK